MSTTSANMSLTIPDLNGDPGVWDSGINSSLALIDLHDHSSGKGVTVKTAGISINANLTFAGFAATNLVAARFSTTSTIETTARSLWVYSVDGELYWRNGTGSNIKITSGTGLNMSLVGGIAGDYAAASASLYYDDAAEAYRFLEAAPSPNSWSRVLCGDLDLYEHTSGATNRVRLSSPAALAASYALTFPAAAAGSTLLWQVTSAGAITFSNTIVNAVTFSGLTTHSAGATMAANQHVTVSGTGEIKHGDRILTINAQAAQYDAGWSVSGTFLLSTAGGTAVLCIPLVVGQRIKSVTYALKGDSSADLTTDVKVLDTSGGSASIGSLVSTNPTSTIADSTINVTDTTITDAYAIVITFVASATNISIGNVRVTYDRP